MLVISIKKATAALAVCVLFAGACGGGSSETTKEVDRKEALAFVTSYFRGIGESVRTAPPWYRTLDEVLPNVDYVRPDGKKDKVSDLAVVGRITKVDEGKGFYVPGEDHPSGIATDFDDERSRWRFVHATIEVDRVIGGGREPSGGVQVALPLYDKDEFDILAAGLSALGNVVLFLDEGSPLVTYDPSLYVVVAQHTMIATVAEDGRLALPMLGTEQAEAMLAAAPTLADLERHAGTPRVIVLAPGPEPNTPTRPELPR